MSDLRFQVEHQFSWMRANPTWRREIELLNKLLAENEQLRVIQCTMAYQDKEPCRAVAERNAEIERLRGLSDITRLDVMWQELVKERYAAEDNAAILAAEVKNLRAEIKQLHELIRDLNDHEGAEGWSQALRERVREALGE